MLYGSGKFGSYETNAMTGAEAREILQNAMGYGSGFTIKEQQQRHDEAIKMAQEEGIVPLIAQCRIGNQAMDEAAAKLALIGLREGTTAMNTPATMERAATKLAYMAERSGQIACNIVSAGGVKPLVAMMTVPVELGDDDDEFSMQEMAVKAIHALCIGDASNQRPVAEGGAIPPMIKMLGEADHPWSIKESAAAALARLAKEPAGGPAQEIITARGGVPTFIAVHRDPACTEACKVFLAEALRLLMPYTPAKEEMRGYDILRFGGDNGVEVVL